MHQDRRSSKHKPGNRQRKTTLISKPPGLFEKRTVVVGKLADLSKINDLIVFASRPDEHPNNRDEDRMFPITINVGTPCYGCDGCMIDEESDHEVWPEQDRGAIPISFGTFS